MSDQPQAEHPSSDGPSPGDRWGDPISDERRRELQDMLDAWNAPEADHGERKGPFDGTSLSGADVSWLAEQSGRHWSGAVPNLHLEGALLSQEHLAGADLREAHLEGARLHRTYLEGARLSTAHLAGADLSEAHLEGAYLFLAHLEGA